MIGFLFNPFQALLKDKKLTVDVKLFSFLIFLLPLALISGPALPDIILSIIALYFLILSFVKKLWSYYKNKFVYFFLIFSVFIILRAIFSDFPYSSLLNEGSVFYFRYLFFILGVWYLIDKNKYLSKCLLAILILCLVVTSINGLKQYFFHIDFFGNERFSEDRLSGFFFGEPIIGRYISSLSIFTFALIYREFKNNKTKILFSSVMIFVSLVMVFMTGERAPLFNILLFVVLVFIFYKNYRFFFISGFCLSCLILFITVLFNPSAKERIIDLTYVQMTDTKIPLLPYSEIHERHYITAIRMFIDKPLIGVGTNLFRNMCNNHKYHYKQLSCSTHPHNIYIQLLAETGILGFLFLFIYLIYLSSLIFKHFLVNLTKLPQNEYSFEVTLFVFIQFIFWWPFIPHMSLYNNWNNIFVMLPLGFLFSYLYRK